MSEVRFKPGDMVKHKVTGEMLTFKEYGAAQWEGWAVVTHRHGNTIAPTWWNLEDCSLDVTAKALVEFTEKTIEQGNEIKELRTLCNRAKDSISCGAYIDADGLPVRCSICPDRDGDVCTKRHFRFEIYQMLRAAGE